MGKKAKTKTGNQSAIDATASIRAFASRAINAPVRARHVAEFAGGVAIYHKAIVPKMLNRGKDLPTGMGATALAGAITTVVIEGALAGGTQIMGYLNARKQLADLNKTTDEKVEAADG